MAKFNRCRASVSSRDPFPGHRDCHLPLSTLKYLKHLSAAQSWGVFPILALPPGLAVPPVPAAVSPPGLCCHLRALPGRFHLHFRQGLVRRLSQDSW
jgi:hypothetical protein